MLLRRPEEIGHRGGKLWCHGNRELLNQRLHAVLCSRACPGDKIIQAIDLAQRWRAETRPVVSGFHTSVEKECLRIFLRGPQHIVICAARGLDPFQLPADWQRKFESSEMIIVSPFDPSIRRPTKETGEIRNKLVVDLAIDVTIIYASPGGYLDQLINSSTSSKATSSRS
jgi:predicted Rossmann fold nucleotide-binding protein DprA/Smf involved in DNA uptake